MHVRDATSPLWLTLLGICVLGWHATGLAQDEAPQRVLFLVPDLEATVRAQLQDALAAQLSLVGAELVLRDDTTAGPSGSAHDRANEIGARAQQEEARIALWLEVEAERWTLHVMDVGQGRAVSRRIDARPAQQAAAVETVAVLAREASRAGPLALSPEADAEPAAALPPSPEPAVPAVTEDTPPEPPAPEPTNPALRLSLFYIGADFAPETAFSHGAALGARLDWQSGIFAGLNAGWTALAKPAGPLVVQRVPLWGSAGYRARLFEDLSADFELGLWVDLLQRTTRLTATDQGAEGSSLRAVAALAPRLRLDYRLGKTLSTFIGFGLDIALTPLRYETRTTTAETVLSPSWVRPALEAGVAFYP